MPGEPIGTTRGERRQACDRRRVPEGDTIHRLAAQMRPILEGSAPEVLAPHPRHRHDRWPEQLSGRPVRMVEAKGKHLLVRFEGGLTMHSHLRMSGIWDVRRRGERWRRARSRAWLVLRSGGWEVIQFDGPLLELRSDARLRADPRLSRLGPDVLGERFDPARFLARLRSGDQERAIGDALLDQETVAGIGNLWKSESCFAVGLDPWRPVREVREEQALELVGFARTRMQLAVRDGHRARPRQVYGLAGRPCPRCGAPIRSRGQGENNRLTFWCASCQR
jgi:endonuclease-8